MPFFINKNILDFINLHQGEEQREKVLANIKSNTSFRGSNIWILACAIVIASVGLNVNSTAVIIGAMLISPLMGPIVGMGFALAIYDFSLLKKSAKNLLIATAVSLLVAGIYFLVSPFKDAQSELLARTSPTIYDVLIAFFGGLVGVIALTRLEKGNPIPGVAIATALMPPLCTAGYGLAIGNYVYFFGAMYLYTINCVFICISTFIIVKYLRYEPVSHYKPAFEKRIKLGISTLIFLIIIPSVYLAYNLYREKSFHQKADRFITAEFSNNNYTLIYKKIKYNANPKSIELAFLTKKVTPEQLAKLKQKLKDYGLPNTDLIIRQELKDIKGEILAELKKEDKELADKDILINNLQKELKNFQPFDSETGKEVAILFPELKQVTMGSHLLYPETDSARILLVFVGTIEDEKSKFDQQQLQQWLSQKYNTTLVKVVIERP